MKVTKEQLYNIIKEEIAGVLEGWRKGDPSKTRPGHEDYEAHRGTERRSADPEYGDLEGIKDYEPVFEEGDLKEEDDWIQKAVNPEHEGYCTPMTKSTCTPRRKALAKRFKKAAHKKDKKGGTGWQGKV